MTVASGLESVLRRELQTLGVSRIKPVGSGVYFSGSLRDAYRVCLWSRVANRVLLPLGEFAARSPEELYRQIREFDWSRHLDVEGTLAVDFFSANSAITHTRYGALKVKDAIVDQFRDALGTRPNVDRERPSIRINVYVFRDKARLSLDLAGMGLHRRFYRDEQSMAPLKENLAAALLLAMDWPEFAKEGKSFCDPLCGSGTLLIEAAMMAADMAPQLRREYFGFSGWKQHQAEIWQSLLEEANQRASSGLASLNCLIAGSDKSSRVVRIARSNIDRAGLGDAISVRAGDMEQVPYPDQFTPGLVLCNPPYGVRLDSEAGIGALYKSMGRVFQSRFGGWHVGVFTATTDLAHRMRLKTHTVLKCSNGGLDCKLLKAHIPRNKVIDHKINKPADENRNRKSAAASSQHKVHAGMFVNRLRKNFKPLQKWAKNEAIGCYRIYDADLPEFSMAIDLYESEQRHVHVQEYRAPASIDRSLAAARLSAAVEVLPDVLGCDSQHIHIKQRRRQSGRSQYGKRHEGGETHIINEFGSRFEVNLEDYLDTGIFPDHRKIRFWIRQRAKAKRFLNLFAYTGTATVHAAAGGALSTTTVDMSAAYLAWAQRNLALNDCAAGKHEFLREDCLKWLDQRPNPAPYDLILLDPPTFSNSAKMERDWDVQRDHVSLIRRTMRLLHPDGLLIFSNNFRRFRLMEKGLERFSIDNKTRASIPRDFSRNPKIHQCFFIRHR